MQAITNLINYNQEKNEHLINYLNCNDMIAEMTRLDSVSSIEEIVNKKRGVIASINVLDNKIIAGIDTLKSELGIDDLSELNVNEYPAIVDLKFIAGEVLKKMVDVGISDKHTLKYIDALFNRLETSDSNFDKRKMFNYTKNFFGLE